MNYGTTEVLCSVPSERFCLKVLNRYYPINICIIMVALPVFTHQNAISVLM